MVQRLQLIGVVCLQNPKNKECKEETANEKAKRKAMFLSSVCGVSASFPQVMIRVLNVLVFLFGLYLGTVCKKLPFNVLYV
jgi:hypothetical protein